MEEMRDHGASLQTIADELGTSRQVKGRYLTRPPMPGCTMQMIYMYRKQPCTVIDVVFLNRKNAIQNQTSDLIHRAFGVVENPTWEDFKIFLEDRCFPETRGNKKELLDELGLMEYDPLQIVEKNQGRMADDDMWLKIRYLERKAQ